MTVDHHDPTPIYRQIAAILKAKILSGEYQPRQVLPSELQLQQEHGVARATVRHAIEALRDEGLVYTLPQRGTYVSPRDQT
ncbi:winged helix-turn-helix domain-containing protein [Nonomuraea sp. NPDC050404]|uniref:winged helix-turn-helix domain-containing protein n=1 Tax=Nonomuraea sp. NPDC050404 TaxID=3155783 RepID=UPI0033D73D3E